MSVTHWLMALSSCVVLLSEFRMSCRTSMRMAYTPRSRASACTSFAPPRRVSTMRSCWASVCWSAIVSGSGLGLLSRSTTSSGLFFHESGSRNVCMSSTIVAPASSAARIRSLNRVACLHLGRLLSQSALVLLLRMRLLCLLLSAIRVAKYLAWRSHPGSFFSGTTQLWGTVMTIAMRHQFLFVFCLISFGFDFAYFT